MAQSPRSYIMRVNAVDIERGGAIIKMIGFPASMEADRNSSRKISRMQLMGIPRLNSISDKSLFANYECATTNASISCSNLSQNLNQRSVR